MDTPLHAPSFFPSTRTTDSGAAVIAEAPSGWVRVEDRLQSSATEVAGRRPSALLAQTGESGHALVCSRTFIDGSWWIALLDVTHRRVRRTVFRVDGTVAPDATWMRSVIDAPAMVVLGTEADEAFFGDALPGVRRVGRVDRAHLIESERAAGWTRTVPRSTRALDIDDEEDPFVSMERRSRAYLRADALTTELLSLCVFSVSLGRESRVA
jgi:hypothetical protein